jgi:hypothetical protein
MTIGSNPAGLLNVIMFEAGYIRRDRLTGEEEVVTVAIHPLVVAPRQISYTDSSRSTVTQTLGSASRTVADRALRTVQLDGVFGVASRGYGTYVGTGPVRHQRFYNEVVRFSDARSVDDISEVINDLSGTPAIRARLARFDPQTCTPFVNFYDLLNQRQFAVNVDSWSDSIGARNGGATGNRMYSMRLTECGPIVSSQLNDDVLRPLFSGLTLWQQGIEVINSYDEAAVLDALPTVGETLVSSAGAAFRALADRAIDARSLFGGTKRPGGGPALVSFFGAVQTAKDAVDDLVDASTLSVQAVDAPPGRVTDWFTQRTFAGIDAATVVEDLEVQKDAVDMTSLAGAFLGLSRDGFARVITTGGTAQRTTTTVTERHTTTDTDTPETIETRYGVDFDDVLEASGMTPDEALTPGATLFIPVRRINGPRYVQGLPTFGSQVDQSAWGTDFTLDLAVDGAGDLEVIGGIDVIVQGVAFLQEGLAATLLADISDLPDDAGEQVISRRLQQTLLSDRRIQAVPRADVNRTGSGLTLEVEIIPINVTTSVIVSAS